MWRSPHITLPLLNQLIIDDDVGEVIIIGNNNLTFELPKSNKINYLQQDTNLYVNPSWNLGVRLAKNKKICLLNDDVLIPNNLFLMMNKLNLEDFGLIGIDGQSISYQIESLDPWQEQNNYLKITEQMNYGYGICMFIHQNNWVTIPDQIKVWFGDNYLFVSNIINNKKNLLLTTSIKTQMSSTSSDPIFNEIKIKDEKNYLNWLNESIMKHNL